MATKAAQLTGSRFRRVCMVVALTIGLPASGAEFAAEVYRNESMTVSAGLQGNGQYVHFGDMLVLIIAVSYDADSISIQELDGSLFTQAWPADSGAQLVDWQTHRDPGSKLRQDHVRVSYRFQILGCPDDSTPTCPGDRDYPLPEFVLGYQDLNARADAARSIRFRPWPETLTVLTTLQSDDEGQLYPFKTYFPTGGYPGPLVGENGLRASVVTAGVTLALMMGGFMMWPFRSRTDKNTKADMPRWQKQLQTLRETDSEDDARYLDALRRCLVWYCNDELQIDPFLWLDLAESGDESDDARTHADLRLLFVDLLHSPAGQGVELRQRLETIVLP